MGLSAEQPALKTAGAPPLMDRQGAGRTEKKIAWEETKRLRRLDRQSDSQKGRRWRKILAGKKGFAEVWRGFLP